MSRALFLFSFGLGVSPRLTKPASNEWLLGNVRASIGSPPVSTASGDLDAAPALAAPYFTAQKPPDEEERKRQNEFRLNVGKVIDTLQSDYPVLFETEPDFSIYEDSIELTDPSGVSIRGLSMYKFLYALLRMLRYTMASVEVKSKVCYAGWDPLKVRVRWNVAFSSVLSPGRTYFVDGVSAYLLSDRGLVTRHDLQNVIVNGREVQQPYLQLKPYLQLVNPLANPNTGAVAIQGAGGVSDSSTMVLHQAAANQAAAEGTTPRKKPPPPRPLFRPRSDLEFCESAYDCEYPLFCCDLLLTKVCCSNGAFAPVPQGIPIPIPVPVDHDPWGLR